MSNFLSRVASAPISWGICEVPGWGKMLPTKRVLSEMQKLGLAGTELGAPGFLPNQPNQIVDLLADYELKLLGGFTPVVVHDSSEYVRTIEYVKQVIELFRKTGATHLVSSPVYSWNWDIPKPLTNDQLRYMFKTFDEIDKICADNGIKNVLHPHLMTVVETKEDVERVLAGCDVNWCLDTGHLAIGGVDVVEFAKIAIDRIGHVHLKDVDLSKVDDVLSRKKSIMQGVQDGLFTPLGKGDVPIAEVVKLLESSGYQGWYVIEQDLAITGELPTEGNGPIKLVSQSLDYLKGLAIA
ncbi:MAG: TIM barrel protein [Actinomycetota bacterium]